MKKEEITESHLQKVINFFPAFTFTANKHLKLIISGIYFQKSSLLELSHPVRWLDWSQYVKLKKKKKRWIIKQGFLSNFRIQLLLKSLSLTRHFSKCYLYFLIESPGNFHTQAEGPLQVTFYVSVQQKHNSGSTSKNVPKASDLACKIQARGILSKSTLKHLKKE